MTGGELERWQLEWNLLEKVIDRVERAERPILEELHLPADAAGIFAILQGEQAASWPETPRARTRALHAMLTLANLDAAKRHARELEGGSPRIAAYHALLAGIYAGDAATKAVFVLERTAALQRATAAAAAQKRSEREDQDAGILRLADDYRKHHPARSSDRATAAAIAEGAGLSPNTIRRRLGKLKIADPVRRK